MHTTPRLEVVVSSRCEQCGEAVGIAETIAREFPQVRVEVINLGAPNAVKPDVVFAVPTYLLNGRIVSLGNPSLQEMRDHITNIGANSPAASFLKDA